MRRTLPRLSHSATSLLPSRITPYYVSKEDYLPLTTQFLKENRHSDRFTPPICYRGGSGLANGAMPGIGFLPRSWENGKTHTTKTPSGISTSYSLSVARQFSACTEIGYVAALDIRFQHYYSLPQIKAVHPRLTEQEYTRPSDIGGPLYKGALYYAHKDPKNHWSKAEFEVTALMAVPFESMLGFHTHSSKATLGTAINPTYMALEILEAAGLMPFFLQYVILLTQEASFLMTASLSSPRVQDFLEMKAELSRAYQAGKIKITRCKEKLLPKSEWKKYYSALFFVSEETRRKRAEKNLPEKKEISTPTA